MKPTDKNKYNGLGGVLAEALQELSQKETTVFRMNITENFPAWIEEQKEKAQKAMQEQNET